MKAKTNLTQQTGLRQHLSPQQVRFVRLLEMSGPEIEDAVRNELEENPALEATDSEDFDALNNIDSREYNESSDQLQAGDYVNEDDTPSYLLHASKHGSEENSPTIWDRHSEWPTLVESLENQLNVIDADKKTIAIARYLVGYLDHNGRLSRSLKDIAEDMSISLGVNVTRADLLPALNIIRYQLDPPGLGAVDLRECLLIQLQRREPKTLAVRAAEEIIRDYFDIFTKKHFDRLQNALGVKKEILEESIAVIRSLDPKPGSSMHDGNVDRLSHITPDFIVTPTEGEPGRFTITLNQHLPQLSIEESFNTDSNSQEGQLFIKRKRDDAHTFIGLMKRRSDTLISVMKAIVAIQKKFFETEDLADLKPMILNDLSKKTGLDRSVISRAASNKYVATQSGIYPLKIFFNDTPTEDHDTSSSEILAALQQIIDLEDKKHPLSDRALTDALKDRGYNLARRTVTKYREKSNIPVARLRKEF